MRLASILRSRGQFRLSPGNLLRGCMHRYCKCISMINGWIIVQKWFDAIAEVIATIALDNVVSIFGHKRENDFL